MTRRYPHRVSRRLAGRAPLKHWRGLRPKPDRNSRPAATGRAGACAASANARQARVLCTLSSRARFRNRALLARYQQLALTAGESLRASAPVACVAEPSHATPMKAIFRSTPSRLTRPWVLFTHAVAPTSQTACRVPLGAAVGVACPLISPGGDAPDFIGRQTPAAFLDRLP